MAPLTAGLKLVRISMVTPHYISCRFIPFQGFARSYEILGTEPVRGGDEKIGGTGMSSYSPIARIQCPLGLATFLGLYGEQSTVQVITFYHQEWNL